jgi:acetoin utilization deacetylase AcuC-like enzyme
MNFGVSEACLGHDPGPRHPDAADRIAAIKRGLEDRRGVEYVERGPADRATVEAVHDPEYVAEFEAFCEAGGGDWDADTTASEGTWPAALAGAGLAAWAATEALAGADGSTAPFALSRPPGHHAKSDDAGGFCFLNNAAIGAQAALDAGADRVAVLDWDAHHGDGTQEIFYDREDVLVVSVHEENLFPPTGAVEEVGTGPGEGATVNVPLPSGAGDPEYRLVFEDVLRPAIGRFEPDVVIVSAGFDAHRHDPISRLRVSTEGYGVLTDLVRTFADDAGAGLGFTLEGGYHNLGELADAVGMVHEVFEGHPPTPETGDPDPEVRSLVEALQERHCD